MGLTTKPEPLTHRVKFMDDRQLLDAHKKEWHKAEDLRRRFLEKEAKRVLAGDYRIYHAEILRRLEQRYGE